eukprot:CAMPEP_0174255468 /NCGR_PEP_ID=MMETSP0439-20130205/4803_1 /TAXON_ID=0 /ORGANISM="Stereomyxa ramosa, Strain Chinc5" /LENGTH=363 /DNA_ID=CAMNT_0015337673 /DNA_START=76 /DNA_END=1164 /DNA_ORIENTATION=-
MLADSPLPQNQRGVRKELLGKFVTQEKQFEMRRGVVPDFMENDEQPEKENISIHDGCEVGYYLHPGLWPPTKNEDSLCFGRLRINSENVKFGIVCDGHSLSHSMIDTSVYAARRIAEFLTELFPPEGYMKQTNPQPKHKESKGKKKQKNRKSHTKNSPIQNSHELPDSKTNNKQNNQKRARFKEEEEELLSDEELIEKIEEIFSIVDDEIKQKDESFKTELGGTTVVLSLIFLSKIITANVGDSRSVYISPDFTKTHVLTVDHDTNNQSEVDRIQEFYYLPPGAKGPAQFRESGAGTRTLIIPYSTEEMEQQKPPKSFGFQIKVTRSLGDKIGPKDLLACEPSVSIAKGKKGMFVVLATDGIW